VSKSKIEWTDETWNPVRGTKARHRCVKISPGCDFCYASAYNARYCGGDDFPDVSQVDLSPARHGVPLLVMPSGTEIDTVRLDEEIVLEPLRWKRSRMVFVCSMTDVAGEWVPAEWLDRMWAVMALASQHVYQVLTKRPKRLYEWLSDPGTPLRIDAEMAKIAAARGYCKDEIEEWPLPHVMVGVTVEMDRYAWRANKYLRMMPAATKFVSAEPLLGPLPSLELLCPACKGHGVEPERCPAGIACDSEHDFSEWCSVCEGKGWVVDWLIVGGESRGPADRRLVETCAGKACSHPDCDPHSHCGNHLLVPAADGLAFEDTGLVAKSEALDWVRDLRDRAVAARTHFFMKQWGGAWPKAGGRKLDGRTWDETPPVHRQTA
jgi:protein gp37